MKVVTSRSVWCQAFGHWKAVEVCRARPYEDCTYCTQLEQDVARFGKRTKRVVDTTAGPTRRPKKEEEEEKPKAAEVVDVSAKAALDAAFKKLTDRPAPPESIVALGPKPKRKGKRDGEDADKQRKRKRR